MSLKEQILDHARQHPLAWIHGGEYQRMAMGLRYMPSNADRRLRELSSGENPALEKRERTDGTMEYRYRGVQTEAREEEKVAFQPAMI